MRKNRLLTMILLGLTLASHQTHALDPSSLLNEEQTEAIMQENRNSNKYSCSPEDLANYIDVVSAPLKVRTKIPNGQEHTNNRAAEQQLKGEEDCSMNFADMAVVKDIKKLIQKIQNFEVNVPSSSDPVWPLVKQLAKQVYDALLQGVCGALTEELAMELVAEIMNHELGFDLDDIDAFDKNEFALDAASDYLEKQGIDSDILDPEEWEDIFGDHTKDIYNKQKDEMMDNMFN